MLNFLKFKKAVQKQFDMMSVHELFRTSIDKNTLWNTYLNSFPEGTNPIFRERTEHDCQCCKQFIMAAGNVVTIIDNNIVSIVKRVIEVKLAEAENNEKRVTEAAHRQRILDIIADKKDEGLKSKSVEELESMLLDSK